MIQINDTGRDCVLYAILKEDDDLYVDISENIIYSFKSARDAGDNTDISKESITKCVNHTSQTAGKYDGKKLQWEFQDEEHRAQIDKKRPRRAM